MSHRVPVRPSRRALVAGLLFGTTLVLAACGGGSAPTTPAEASPDEPAATAVAGEPTAAAGSGESGGETGGSTSGLATLVTAEQLDAALGETPSPECDTSSLSGSASCVWTAADGSWLKLEDGTPAEMPDLESFTQRVTATLGLDEPVEGLGEAAYLGSSSRGTRIAVYVGDGRTVWVVLNAPGDAAAQAPIVREIASAVVAAL